MTEEKKSKDKDNVTPTQKSERTSGKEARKTTIKAKVGGVKKTKDRKKAPVLKQGRGKKYLEALKLIKIDKLYSINEAVDLAIKTATTKFDATVELHIQTGLDPKNADQNIRGTVAMPAGLGKEITILVFAEGEDAKAAKAAGADFVGDEDMIDKIKTGWLGFDMAIATPSLMPKVGQLGKTLGTKGLMPNPKSGTVTPNPAKAVEEFKRGKVEYKLDKDAIIHLGIGKVSLGSEKLMQNITELFKALKLAKPAGAKGVYLKKGSIATSMGPAIKIDLSTL